MNNFMLQVSNPKQITITTSSARRTSIEPRQSAFNRFFPHNGLDNSSSDKDYRIPNTEMRAHSEQSQNQDTLLDTESGMFESHPGDYSSKSRQQNQMGKLLIQQNGGFSAIQQFTQQIAANHPSQSGGSTTTGDQQQNQFNQFLQVPSANNMKSQETPQWLSVQTPKKRPMANFFSAKTVGKVKAGAASLKHDMKFGWRPRESPKAAPVVLPPEKPPAPIELKLPDINDDPQQLGVNEEQELQRSRHQMGRSDSRMQLHRGQKIFQGMRVTNSYQIHEQFQTQVQLPQHKNQIPEEQKQHNYASTVKFDSEFESGNLDQVYQVSENEFNLFLRPDFNTKGFQNWFYFRFSRAASNQQKIKFNIMNMFKKKILFRNQAKPVICFNPNGAKPDWCTNQISDVLYFSLNRPDKNLWKRGGDNSDEEDNAYNDKPTKGQPWYSNLRNKQKQNLYCLTFQVTLKPNQQQIALAANTPYLYSDLMTWLDRQNFEKGPKNLLCKSLMGLPIPICSFGTGPKIIIVVGRVHPGETNSSWVVQGLLNYLSSNKNPEVKTLLEKVTIKVIPMINVDGVVGGNYRCGLIGKDMNRLYIQDDLEEQYQLNKLLMPETQAMKKLMNQHKQNLMLFIDVHQHSQKRGAFFYGPHHGMGATGNKYQEVRVLPKMLDHKSKDVFRYASCRFKNMEHYKENCARYWTERDCGVVHSYCMEISQQGYYSSQVLQGKRQLVEFNQSNMQDFGINFGQAISQFTSLYIQQEERRAMRVEISRVNKVKYASRKSANPRTKRLKKKDIDKENSEIDTQSQMEGQTPEEMETNNPMGAFIARQLIPLHKETIKECTGEGGSSGSDSDWNDGESDNQEYEWNIQQAIWANALHAIDPSKYKKTVIPAPAQTSSKERLKKPDIVVKPHNHSAAKIDTHPIIIKRIPRKRDQGYAPKKIIPKTEIMMAKSPALNQPTNIIQSGQYPQDGSYQETFLSRDFRESRQAWQQAPSKLNQQQKNIAQAPFNMNSAQIPRRNINAFQNSNLQTSMFDANQNSSLSPPKAQFFAQQYTGEQHREPVKVVNPQQQFNSFLQEALPDGQQQFTVIPIKSQQSREIQVYQKPNIQGSVNPTQGKLVKGHTSQPITKKQAGPSPVPVFGLSTAPSSALLTNAAGNPLTTLAQHQHQQSIAHVPQIASTTVSNQNMEKPLRPMSQIMYKRSNFMQHESAFAEHKNKGTGRLLDEAGQVDEEAVQLLRQPYVARKQPNIAYARGLIKNNRMFT